jgi:hypothetical protein
MRSYESLLDASGYAARPQEFVELIRILDREVWLITPSDPEVGHRKAVSPRSFQRNWPRVKIGFADIV